MSGQLRLLGERDSWASWARGSVHPRSRLDFGPELPWASTLLCPCPSESTGSSLRHRPREAQLSSLVPADRCLLAYLLEGKGGCH